MPTARRILETPRDCSTGSCADPVNPVLAESAEIEWPGIGMIPNERESAFGDDHTCTLTSRRGSRRETREVGKHRTRSPICRTTPRGGAGSQGAGVAFHPTGNTPKSRRLFCPTSQARPAKRFIFPQDRNYDLKKPSRLATEGRSANRHDTLGGMRWTLPAREMMRAGCGRSSRVVLSPRRWGQVCRDDRQATVAKKPETPGRARSSRKEPSCRECRNVR